MRTKYLYIAFVIFFFFFINSTFALKIDLTDNQTYRPNQWLVELGDISLQMDNSGEIMKDTWFSLIVPDEARFRFYSIQSPIISWTGSSKIFSGTSINSAMTMLHFNIGDNLLPWDILKISGIKLVIYDRQSTQNIGIDITGDNKSDLFTSFFVRVNDILSYHDALGPSEVFNFTWSIVGNNLILNGDVPGDIDFQAFQIYTYDINGWKLRDYFTPILQNYQINLPNTLASLQIKTVDFRANYSTGITYSIDYFRPVILINTGIVDISKASTTTIVSTGVTMTWSQSETKVEIVKIERYMPVFQTKGYADFMILFDQMIDRKEYKKEVREIRNQIISLIKDYEDNKISKYFVILELKRLITEFKKVF